MGLDEVGECVVGWGGWGTGRLVVERMGRCEKGRGTPALSLLISVSGWGRVAEATGAHGHPLDLDANSFLSLQVS